MIESSIIAGLVGGISRLAPEVVKIFSKKTDQAHELALLKAEMEFAKIRGEIDMKKTEASMTISELDAIGKAFQEQSTTAAQGGKFVSAISALVRPLVTYWFMTLYSLVKVTTMYSGLAEGGSWKEIVVANWTNDDMSLLTMILSFYFVGRVYDRVKKPQ